MRLAVAISFFGVGLLTAPTAAAFDALGRGLSVGLPHFAMGRLGDSLPTASEDLRGIRRGPWDVDIRPLGVGLGPSALSLALSLSPSDPGIFDSGGSVRTWAPLVLLFAANAVLQAVVDPPDDPRWSRRNSFDDSIRDAFKAGTRDGRDTANTVGDALFGTLAGALVVDWWWLRDEYPALDSFRRDTSWLLSNNLVTRILKLSAGRERPYGRPCEVDPDYVSGCFSDRTNASFYSGHASNTATIAGLLCARHLARPRRGIGDYLVCGGAAAGSMATGFMRMTADKHFATDVITGWVSGAVFGYLLPRYFHYGKSASSPPSTLSSFSLTPVVSRRYYGFHYSVTF